VHDILSLFFENFHGENLGKIKASPGEVRMDAGIGNPRDHTYNFGDLITEPAVTL